jgi:hypothetical protein
MVGTFHLRLFTNSKLFILFCFSVPQFAFVAQEPLKKINAEGFRLRKPSSKKTI